MNVMGIGTWELLAILFIMLTVAGPKRMIHWSYQLGQLLGKLRQQWTTISRAIHQEFSEQGLAAPLPPRKE